MAAGRDPATRPVFLRLHGVANGRFIVSDNLNEEYKVGIFAKPGEYETWVRFSSDVQPGVPDLKGTVGIGIKLFGVEGPKLLEPDQDASTHDFIFQNHDVFFVDTAKDMCEFTCAALHGKIEEYLEAHKITDDILNEMEKVVDSVLQTPYWSVLPSRFGEGRYVKYKLEPVEAPPADEPPDHDDPFYLRADLHARMRKGYARFRFMVQFQTNDRDMPLDKATQRWDERLSEPVELGILELPQQDLDTRNQSVYGENLAFNTWHALEEHQPVGSIAEARKVVYRASASNRRNVNGVPLAEPAEPRPAQYAPGVDYPAAKDERIVRAAIHPAIGIARVGDSETDFYIGPELIDPPAKPSGFYRDDSGALKREAAQFRIYGYNAAGQVVRELTADWAKITWGVHLANHKAAWYQWQIAMDIPEAADTVLPRRNAKVADRETLVIDAGMQYISGKSAQPIVCSGHFTGVPVKIGELQTDAAGRLQVLGGHGESASPKGTPIFDKDDPDSFINADGWYDDTCDGVVTANVNIEGRDIPVEAAWVVTAPPNYGPQVKSVRTMYDLLYDLYVQAGWLQPPGVISFTHDVYPILFRLTDLQWTNQGFAENFGHDTMFDFANPELIEKLSTLPVDPGYDPHKALRRQIFLNFRPPYPTDGNQLPWPWLYGDAMQVPAGESPRQNASVSATQYEVLRRWVDGDFTPDWDPNRKKPSSLSEVRLAEQPATLDRAALDFMLADAFHPGCELTWPMRHLSLYSKPFRIRVRPAGEPEPDYGKTLDQATILSVDGPLHTQGPGDLTRWMGLPWQADTAYCRSGYDRQYDPYMPTFWPARVPNHVLSERDYAIVVDREQDMKARKEAFGRRTNWNLPLGAGAPTAVQMEKMVEIFGSMGLLESRHNPDMEPLFPNTMLVASYGPDVPPSATVSTRGAKRVPGAAGVHSEEMALEAANFASHEEALAAPLPVRRGKLGVSTAKPDTPQAAMASKGAQVNPKQRAWSGAANFASDEEAQAAPLPVRPGKPRK
ncbi:LodA/GoxA family CTQ-dependent oxidase [Dyella subtropica]|uniref:LodA/GoxA family CTQ-dependent oxidase n=1 Tax=Dyella subtropica TaxID=2992127 RepID=UPI0022592E96|nr:LodA/GoxA family CTQ-dependent oxidase [Dyella subtropica]